jgi:hypothetical protein
MIAARTDCGHDRWGGRREHLAAFDLPTVRAFHRWQLAEHWPAELATTAPVELLANTPLRGRDLRIDRPTRRSFLGAISERRAAGLRASRRVGGQRVMLDGVELLHEIERITA